MSGLTDWGPAVVIILGYVMGFYFQNRRLDDFRDAMNQRFGDMDRRNDARFSDLKDFIRAGVSRLEDRLDRLEHPVARP